MKVFLAAFFITVGIATAYAGGLMMLHVGSADGAASVLTPCGNGTINLSTGCTQPMLGGL